MLFHQVSGIQSLKTVVMTDVAGFTEIMRTNEPQALPLLRVDIEMIRAHIARNGGEVIKVAGDGILALFSSAPNAVRACIDAQESLSESTLRHRMAIHAGEVTVTHGDAYGDAVNVCSRLEAITTPGTVSASRIVIDLIEAQGLPNPIKRGKVQLKGIDGSMELYSWGAESRRIFNTRRMAYAVGALLVLIAICLGTIWNLNSEKSRTGDRKSLPPIMLSSMNNGSNTEAPNIDELMDQALNELWDELDEYEKVKEEAVERVDAKVAIDWLQKNPIGKRERGKWELVRWGLVDRAIEKGRSLVGPKATAEEIWNALSNHPELGMDLEKSAFAEEFRRPK